MGFLGMSNRGYMRVQDISAFSKGNEGGVLECNINELVVVVSKVFATFDARKKDSRNQEEVLYMVL